MKPGREHELHSVQSKHHHTASLWKPKKGAFKGNCPDQKSPRLAVFTFDVELFLIRPLKELRSCPHPFKVYNWGHIQGDVHLHYRYYPIGTGWEQYPSFSLKRRVGPHPLIVPITDNDNFVFQNVFLLRHEYWASGNS